jgi:hypothetical protein
MGFYTLPDEKIIKVNELAFLGLVPFIVSLDYTKEKRYCRG